MAVLGSSIQQQIKIMTKIWTNGDGENIVGKG